MKITEKNKMNKEKITIYQKYTRSIMLINEIENIITKDIPSDYKFFVIQKLIDIWREESK